MTDEPRGDNGDATEHQHERAAAGSVPSRNDGTSREPTTLVSSVRTAARSSDAATAATSQQPRGGDGGRDIRRSDHSRQHGTRGSLDMNKGNDGGERFSGRRGAVPGVPNYRGGAVKGQLKVGPESDTVGHSGVPSRWSALGAVGYDGVIPNKEAGGAALLRARRVQGAPAQGTGGSVFASHGKGSSSFLGGGRSGPSSSSSAKRPCRADFPVRVAGGSRIDERT